MTTPTSNPVPSNDPRDLLFNAEALDSAVNSAALEFTDRKGLNRLTVAGATNLLKVINPRGPWASGTLYQPRDLVSNSGTWYVCLDTHTSGATFAADQAAHWAVHQGVLASDLDNTSSATKGSGQSSHSGVLNYVAKSLGGVLNNTVMNVKMFPWLAKGDGSSDDTAALNAAAAALQNGQSMFFPPGDYIVDTGCVLFRGKSRIRVFGAGTATRIRPSVQGVAPSKQDYPTTMAIDQCSSVTVHDMVIESKGESYGNADAYGGLAGGDPRTNALISYGGHALLVSRCDGVNLRNIEGRRCGSVGVFYLSSCQRVVVENCFANAMSLGYAGFAVDNWAHSTINTLRTYTFSDCRVGKEGATYAAKAGIASEGDELPGRQINLIANGCVFEDCIQGGDFPQGGCGITAYETRLTVIGMVTKNCLYGVSYFKRGGATEFTWCRITGCSFESNAVAGVLFAIGTATGGADLSVSATKINSQPTSQWAGVGTVTNLALKESSGIVADGFINGTIKVVSCDITGGQNGLFSVDNANFLVSGGNIVGLNRGVNMFGGGRLEAAGARIEAASAGGIAVDMTTLNKAAAASYVANLLLVGNTLRAGGDSPTDYAVRLGGNSALYGENCIKGNTVPAGQIQADKGSSTVYDRDDVVLSATRRAQNTALASTDTIFEVSLPKEIFANYAYAVGTDGASRAITAITNNQGGVRGLVRIRLAGDVRTLYNSVSNAAVTLVA